MMVCLLLYSYCVGVFSSRKVARAGERNLAFLAIVGEERPDFRTISLFRKNHLDAFANVFVQVLCLAKAAGWSGWARLPHGTTARAMPRGSRDELCRMTRNPPGSWRRPMSCPSRPGTSMLKTIACLRSRRGDELPEELRRRQDRLATIEAAMKRLEAEARAAADAERQRREEAEASGKNVTKGISASGPNQDPSQKLDRIIFSQHPTRP